MCMYIYISNDHIKDGSKCFHQTVNILGQCRLSKVTKWRLSSLLGVTGYYTHS